MSGYGSTYTRRPRPSSALSLGRGLLFAQGQQERAEANPTTINPFAGAYNQGTQPIVLPNGTTIRVGGSSPYTPPVTPFSNTQAAWANPFGAALQFQMPTNVLDVGLARQDLAVRAAMQDVGDAEGGEGSTAYDAAQAEYALWQKEMQLRQAMADGDYAEAQRLLDDIKANRKAIKGSYDTYIGTTRKQSGESAAALQQLVEKYGGGLAAATAQEKQGVAAAKNQSLASVDEAAKLIGAGSAASEAASLMAQRDLELFRQTSETRDQVAERILGALETAAVAGVRGTQAKSELAIGNRRKLMDANFAGRQQEAEQALAEIDQQRQLFAIQYEQGQLEWQRRLEEAFGDSAAGDPVDDVSFGIMSAQQYMLTQGQAQGIANDRLAMLNKAFEDAQAEGVFDAASMNAWLTQRDENGIPTFAKYGWQQTPSGQVATGMSPAEIKLVTDAMGAYVRGRDSWGNFDALDPNGGEAPNNISHAAEARSGRGAYGARAQFARSITNAVEAAFGVTSWGQWRSTSVKATGARSHNSDHYSGGAVDFHGTSAQMAALASWARRSPFVSFVKYGTAGHTDHVHISFKLGVGPAQASAFTSAMGG